LRNLAINEVSSVDRGAAGNGNVAARVVMMKRDEVRPWDGVGTPPGADRGYRYVKEDSSMREQHNLVNVAKGLGNAVEKGLDGESFAKMQIELASQMFPDEPTPYHALAKLLGTNVGMEMVAKAARSHYEQLQKRSACGDGYQAVLKKNEPQIHFDNSGDGAVDSDSDDGGEIEEPFDRKLKRWMDANPDMSKDAMISYLHQQEKAKRGIG
jgi:hypothetical protein